MRRDEDINCTSWWRQGKTICRVVAIASAKSRLWMVQRHPSIKSVVAHSHFTPICQMQPQPLSLLYKPGSSTGTWKRSLLNSARDMHVVTYHMGAGSTHWWTCEGCAVNEAELFIVSMRMRGCRISCQMASKWVICEWNGEIALDDGGKSLMGRGWMDLGLEQGRGTQGRC